MHTEVRNCNLEKVYPLPLSSQHIEFGPYEEVEKKFQCQKKQPKGDRDFLTRQGFANKNIWSSAEIERTAVGLGSALGCLRREQTLNSVEKSINRIHDVEKLVTVLVGHILFMKYAD